jgi:hypothetical protein
MAGVTISDKRTPTAVRVSSGGLRLAAVAWVLVSLLILGALGLIVLNWEWSGLCAGLVGLFVSVVAYGRTRLVGFHAPLGLFAGLALMEAWLLWRLRGDSEAIDPLVFLGLLAALGGLFVGGVVANVLDGRPPVADETD